MDITRTRRAAREGSKCTLLSSLLKHSGLRRRGIKNIVDTSTVQHHAFTQNLKMISSHLYSTHISIWSSQKTAANVVISSMMVIHFPPVFHSLTLHAQMENCVVVLPSSTQVSAQVSTHLCTLGTDVALGLPLYT